MTINQVYVTLTNYILGGAAAAVVLFLMFRKANAVAATGNKGKMVGWAMGAPIMVIISVIMTGVAINVALPRLQAAINSQPVAGAAQIGNTLTALADGLLFSNGSGYVNNPGGLQLQAPTQNASNDAPLVNGGSTASFTSQPAPVSANSEARIETAADAVQAFLAMEVTPTPVGGGLTYINQFIADNVPTVEVSLTANGSYTVKSGDSLAKIAKAVYGDSSKWSVIWNANRGVIPDPNRITTGTVLVIPAAGSGGNAGLVAVPTAAPASWGKQTTVYVAPVQPSRNLANDQVIINTNNDAVAAIQALGPLPTVAAPVVVAPTATPRAVYTYAELKGQQTPVGGGMAYIEKFLAEQKNPAVASGQ